MNKYEFAAKELQLPAIETFLEETKVELEVRAKKWTESFVSIKGKKRLGDLIGEGEAPKVVFDVSRSGMLFSSVQCVLCKKDIRIGVTKCKTRSGLTCVFHRGNFNKHVQLHHKDYELNKDSN